MEAGIRTLLVDTGISSSGTSTDSMSTVTDKAYTKVGDVTHHI